jgi:hypothetical protein
MGKKHGIWFELLSHIAIHKKVIENYYWIISSGEREYKQTRFRRKGFEILKFQIEFETINGFEVKITKETRISKDDPTLAMTTDYSYSCMSKSNDTHIRYHSPHDEDYLVDSPWHNKHHRHEFDGVIQKIDIYSYDHRPEKYKFKKYTWKGYPAHVKFLDHEEWPFISEFLKEVADLKN